MQINKLVVATNFSDESNHAMKYAAQIAADQQYEIILFNLENLSIHTMNSRASSQSMDEELTVKRKKLEKLASILATEHHISVIPYFATGDFYTELERCIQEHQADVLVMGMANKSAEQDMLGNTTTSAINRFKIPVLSVPLGASYQGIKHVLFACDVSKGIQGHVLQKVKTLAQAHDATVEVFYVSKKLEELQKEHIGALQVTMEGVDHYYKNVSSNQVIQAIMDEIEQTKTDLLIMIPYRYGFWGSLVHRSKTRMMASGNNIPLLSIALN